MQHIAMNWLRRLLGATPRESKPGTVALPDQSSTGTAPVTTVIEECIGTVLHYDENLLERARTQWQFGDWQGLAAIEQSSLELHPDRAMLALLVAAGKLQVGIHDEAHQLIKMAEDWGGNRRLIAQVLISGTYNSLGCAAIAGAQKQRALYFFTQAVALGTFGPDKKLISQARLMHQCKSISHIT